MLGYYYMDWTYILVIVAAIMGMIAQSSVKSTFAKYSRVRSSRALTGAQLASYLLKEGAGDVRVDKARGSLTDHYDPKNGVVNLSESVYDSVSVAALSVAAHECGHVMQDREDYTPMKIRSKLVPIANFGSQASIPLFFIGLIFNFGTLITIGIAFFSLPCYFNLLRCRWSLTLRTVLFSCSNRADIFRVRKCLWQRKYCVRRP